MLWLAVKSLARHTWVHEHVKWLCNIVQCLTEKASKLLHLHDSYVCIGTIEAYDIKLTLYCDISELSTHAVL